MPMLCITKGLPFSGLEKYEEALLCFDKVLGINPDNADALNDKGVTLANLSRHDEALFWYIRPSCLIPTIPTP